jgi:hypothetical protein
VPQSGAGPNHQGQTEQRYGSYDYSNKGEPSTTQNQGSDKRLGKNSKITVLCLKILSILSPTWTQLRNDVWNLHSGNYQRTLSNRNAEYWKRTKIKWCSLGDESTRFFHAMETYRFLKNKSKLLKRDELYQDSEKLRCYRFLQAVLYGYATQYTSQSGKCIDYAKHILCYILIPPYILYSKPKIKSNY